MARKDYLHADLNAVHNTLQRNTNKIQSTPEDGGTVLAKANEKFDSDLNELIKRYTENIASLEGKSQKYADFGEKCRELAGRCRNNLEELQKAQNSEVNNIVLYEKMRLEFFRENARLKSVLSGENAGDTSGGNSEALWLEFCSLKFLHLFRVGFIVCLPVIITIFAGCLLLALVIVLTMGGI